MKDLGQKDDRIGRPEKKLTQLKLKDLDDISSEMIMGIYARSKGDITRSLELSDLRNLLGRFPVYERSMSEWGRFYTSTHTLQNHQPSTGLGMFDAELQPESGVIKIKLRVAFRFVEGNIYEFPTAGLGDLTWQPAEKLAWKMQFVTQTQVKWSGKHRLWCQRDWWEAFRLRTRLVIEEDSENPHYLIRVIKVPRQSAEGIPPASHSWVRNPQKNWDGTIEKGVVTTHSNAMGPPTGHPKGYTHQEAIHLSGHMLGLGDEWGPSAQNGIPQDLLANELGIGAAPARPDKRLMATGDKMDDAYAAPVLEALQALTHTGPWALQRKRSRPVPWQKGNMPKDYVVSESEEKA